MFYEHARSWGSLGTFGVKTGVILGKILAFTPKTYMYSESRKGKASKGSVQVKNSNGRLQLVFSYAGKRHYLSLGFDDTLTTRSLAEMKANQIRLDIISGNFDETLSKVQTAIDSVNA
jgi:hypothetical protein